MNYQQIQSLISYTKSLFPSSDQVPLHRPAFIGREKEYLSSAIDTTFVSTVGESVNAFEKGVAEFTGVSHSVATTSGTAALHALLHVLGVTHGDEVITQSLSFVAASNAIRYCGGVPTYVDVEQDTLGLSVSAMEDFLEANGEMRDDGCCWNRTTGRRIKACIPVHVLGFAADIERIRSLCDRFNILLVEDAAEALGSFRHGVHLGTQSLAGVLSFNGNKILTTGGGGMILTDDEDLTKRLRHITTTARSPDPWLVQHDMVGFNYRLPNINAALGLAQLESLEFFIENKRMLAEKYHDWGKINGVRFLQDSDGCQSNYWLNSLLTENQDERDMLLEMTNAEGIMTRPLWTPMHLLEMNRDCMCGPLESTRWLYERVVSLPSSVVKENLLASR